MAVTEQLEDAARKAAGIGSVAAWPSWTSARVRQELNERHQTLMGDEEIRAHAGYGIQYDYITLTVGQPMYPVPWRAIGGSFEKLDILLPGATEWKQLLKEEVTGSELFDLGPTKPGQPLRYVVEDGFVRLLPTPSSALTIRFAFYMRPSDMVTSQSSTLFGDLVDRGRITLIGPGARQVTVNVIPKDQLISPIADITSNQQRVDIVRPNGTFALSAWGLTQTYSGLVFTFGGTQSLDRVRVGDYVRVEDQTDWPMGLPKENHRMVANRAGMEIAQQIGMEEKAATVGQVVDADLKRFQRARTPQVKSAPTIIPLVPMSRRR